MMDGFRMSLLLSTCLAFYMSPLETDAWITSLSSHQFRRVTSPLFASDPKIAKERSTDTAADYDATTETNQRTGPAQWLLDVALTSPLWKLVMIPMARDKIVQTATANGIPWKDCLQWIHSREGPWNDDKCNNHILDQTTTAAICIPDWYSSSPYHAYDTGHLSWTASLEMELAGAAIGARNYPAQGRDGESYFRQQFEDALLTHARPISDGAIVVDVGCATGTSTRRLAHALPQAQQILGLDLSPYCVGVAQRLLELAPTAEEWVCEIVPDARIEYRWGDGRETGLPDNSVDVVNVQFVAHEVPVNVTTDILREAHRILKPQGQMWLCEMDFQAPAYREQRANPLLFGLIRSTEPFLDVYADGQPAVWECLRDTFGSTVIAAATGRHYAVVATKGGDTPGELHDLRFDECGEYKVEDTHLQVWENKDARID